MTQGAMDKQLATRGDSQPQQPQPGMSTSSVVARLTAMAA
jgi:hypothetical protein